MTREIYLNQIISQFYGSPKRFPFVQLVYKSEENIYEKYLIHKPKIEIECEYWSWDYNDDFSKLTKKANLELLENGNYKSAAKKHKRSIKEEALVGLVEKINEVSIKPGGFEFTDIFMINVGPTYNFQIGIENVIINTTFNKVPRFWKGVRETLVEIVNLVTP